MLKLQEKIETTANNIFTCKVCNKYLKNPVVLPCGETICNEHVDLKAAENESNYFIYKCQICNVDHKAFEEGFSSSKALIGLLSFNNHLDDKSKEIHKSIDEFDEVIKELSLLSKDPWWI